MVFYEGWFSVCDLIFTLMGTLDDLVKQYLSKYKKKSSIDGYMSILTAPIPSVSLLLNNVFRLLFFYI
ncbi:protein of unknown function [Legionella longbeachae NSW150]|uniref:Uncharacterized protein n=1 Tax=Legionella longbeachae serogroup 1 (strain NSW150) TaxID=661367 RepID=D3HQQ7_LEGLN|nr:protein of unknown function [Legionella longbeachae NSW150]